MDADRLRLVCHHARTKSRGRADRRQTFCTGGFCRVAQMTANYDSVGVDVPEDVAKVEKIIRRDYLDVTEARVRDEGKPRLTHDEVKKRYGVK